MRVSRYDHISRILAFDISGYWFDKRLTCSIIKSDFCRNSQLGARGVDHLGFPFAPRMSHRLQSP